MSNGILAGLVSITSACASVEPWAALFCGGIGGILYYFGVKLLSKLRVDDVVLAIPVHCFCGSCEYLDDGLSTQVRVASALRVLRVVRGLSVSWLVLFAHVYVRELWQGK
jgi:ammonia channel protein AmtB|eukprot:COSAG02_NODE_6542_length_3506_cov_2.178750_6_plen_110_part_00